LFTPVQVKGFRQMAKLWTFQDPGEGIHEAEVLKLLVARGDRVREGQEALTVETDKASFDLSCPYAGIVEEITVKEGDRINVGDPLMRIGAAGAVAEAAPAGLAKPAKEAKQAKPTSKTKQEPEAEKTAAQPEAEPTEVPSEEPVQKDEPVPVSSKGAVLERSAQQGPVLASPATRRVARELKVDLRLVPPSGEGGRVLTDDVRAFAEAGPTDKQAAGQAPVKAAGKPADRRPVAAPVERPVLPDFGQWGEIERVPLRSVRRETAKRMALSWSQIPHVTHNDVADITELEAFRQRHVKTIEAKGGKLTLTVLVMKAVVAALHEFPRFNASLDHEAEELILKRYYHLGIALDSERGLLVPVIHDVDRKSLTDLAVELFQLAERVRKGEVKREDVSGGTFTITNPGPMGGTTFTPIINYPEVAILGLGRAKLQPVVEGTVERSEIVPRLLLPISFGFDHRINDGADAARFVNKVIHTLTNLEAYTLAI
jgi:pyruvate dehydrogenase E2 component (dihydrolipoamide acetyltransferase)